MKLALILTALVQALPFALAAPTSTNLSPVPFPGLTLGLTPRDDAIGIQIVMLCRQTQLQDCDYYEIQSGACYEPADAQGQIASIEVPVGVLCWMFLAPGCQVGGLATVIDSSYYDLGPYWTNAAYSWMCINGA